MSIYTPCLKKEGVKWCIIADEESVNPSVKTDKVVEIGRNVTSSEQLAART